MIEYLYDAIRIVAGQDTPVYAVFANDDGSFVSEGCKFVIHRPDGEMIVAVDGTFNPETGQWTFDVPGEATEGLSGRYEYCFQHDGSNLCFRKPFYLM